MSKPASVAGMMMLGDVCAYALGPRAHERVWRFRREPRWYKRTLAIASNPRKGIAIALAEAAVGIGLVLLARRLAR